MGQLSPATRLCDCPTAPGYPLTAPPSASPRNVDKNARNPARLCEVDVFVLRLLLNQRSLSFRRVFASGVVSVLRNAPSVPSTSSICQQISSPKSPIDTRPTASSSIACLPLAQDKFWVWWAPTVLERAQLSKS